MEEMVEMQTFIEATSPRSLRRRFQPMEQYRPSIGNREMCFTTVPTRAASSTNKVFDSNDHFEDIFFSFSFLSPFQIEFFCLAVAYGGFKSIGFEFSRL